jgi:23S rRNA (guanine745-N1)-methyltransferase
MNRSIFICPVCGSPLSREEKAYRCAGSHSYDISKEGYVNLLLANQKQSSDPGDSKEMIDARKSFLSRGYYKPLARAVASAIIKYKRRSLITSLNSRMTYCQRRDLKGIIEGRFETSTGSLQHILNIPPLSETDPVPDTRPKVIPDFTILDAGCGEGYYTDYISKNRSINKSAEIYGIDISREGIKTASKRNSTISYAVAGIYNLPVLSRSVDSLLNIFAPFSEAEFSRVIKDNGTIISVAPGAHHLYEFKKNLYDDVYFNDEEFKLPERFHITETIRVKYELNVHNKEDIANLLKMTPYYHKSSPDRIESFFNGVLELKTTADFVIRIISVA